MAGALPAPLSARLPLGVLVGPLRHQCAFGYGACSAPVTAGSNVPTRETLLCFVAEYVEIVDSLSTN